MKSIFTLLSSLLLNPTPPIITSSDNSDTENIVIGSLIAVAIGVAIIAISLAIGITVKHKSIKKSSAKIAEQKIDNQDTQPQPTAPQQTTPAQSDTKSSHSFLSFLGAIVLLFLLVCGLVFVAKCSIKKMSDGEYNSDGNPILFSRAAAKKDFTLTENYTLNQSFKLIPNVDIKDLEITFKYYDSDRKVISTKAKYIGNVTKSMEYTVKMDFYFFDSEFYKTPDYYVSGGTVSYFK